MKANYSNITLRTDEVDEILAIGHEVLDPLGVKVTSAAAVRLLLKTYKSFSDEQKKKYSAAVERAE